MLAEVSTESSAPLPDTASERLPEIMAIAIYAALLPTCSFIIGVFGFFVGRCSRKIPILDENLPRALHRGQLPPGDS